MNNTKHYWRLENYDHPNGPGIPGIPNGTYDLCLDMYWIEVNDVTTGRDTIKLSPSGKPIYSLGYAQYCLEYYKSVYGSEYGFAELWIEPAYQVIRRNVPYYVPGMDYDPNGSMCQDDYEYFTRTGEYSGIPFPE